MSRFKSALVLIIWCAAFVGGFSQNLTGIWQGFVKMEGPDSASTTFPITLYVVQNGLEMSGTSYNYLENSPFYAEKKFTGTFQKNRFDLDETVLLSENPAPQIGWGLAYGPLFYDAENESLSGELVFSTRNPQASSAAKSEARFQTAQVTIFR